MSPRRYEKASWFLLFPWSLVSIILILLLNTTFSNWFGKNWSWVTLLLIIPAAIFENFKVGYSTIQVMFLKIFYSLLSFLLTGVALGISLAGWYYEKFEQVIIPRINFPWFVLLALVVMLAIEAAQIFSLLKAVKREFLQFDQDN
ncbi:MAG TPA: hypothetical protein VGQ53_12935 [Chitinophagaceae bacterium]|jgi:hypothetical protein|nr:hypothetical protein [Chitinophagaceae bacterium]